MKSNYLLILITILTSLSVATAQQDTTISLFIESHKDTNKINSNYLSLEELMDVKVTTASKESESKFDAPLSISVITREEIVNAGCNSIPEAFRLAPGMIVRQQNTGNFDVHIRGFDNVVPVGDELSMGTNSITLVMIDGRPVNNYFQGGTFWETLPIGIGDVDRIEIIRGPSSALYGPNAAAGVVNIITQRNKTKGVIANADAQYDMNNNLLSYGAIHYNINDKINIGTSFNKSKLYRTSDKYFTYFEYGYVDRDSLFSIGNIGLEERYPDVDNALDNYGVNLFFDYMPTDKIEFNFSGGIQQSETQRIYVDNQITPFTTNTSQSSYFNLNAKAHSFSTQFSYLEGKQNTLGSAGWEYDYNTLDAVLEYEIKWKNFKIRPGFNYRSAIYDDQKAVEEYGEDRAFLSGEKLLNTISGMLRTEYQWKKIRLIAALRIDKYNKPDAVYLPYQFIASYKITSKNLVRFVVSRSNRGAFLLDTYYQQKFQFGAARVEIKGNENLDLLIMDMYELGFRSFLSDKLNIDIELFTEKVSNFALVETVENNNPMVFEFQFSNVPFSARQYGSTFNVDYLPHRNLSLKAFVTFQKTYLTRYPVLNFTGMVVEEQNTTLNSTPDISAGVIINYNYNSRLNFNTSSYFLGVQELNTTTRTDENGGFYTMKPTFVLNAKIAYNFTKWFSAYVNARNVLNSKREEVFWADPLSPMVFIGLNMNLNKKNNF